MNRKHLTAFAIHAALIAGLILAVARPAQAAIAWHESIAAAKAASASSQRPLLVIFTASWSEASERFVQTTLATPEASGLVTACFETVRLDVDANAELARKLGVSHMPTACIIDQNDQLLARFDCAESSADFVSNAGKAIQTAAQARLAGQPVAAPAAPAVATTDPSAPQLPAAPPKWPAEPGTQPTDSQPRSQPAMSAFAAAAASAATETPRPTLEPAAAAAKPPSPPPTPWLSQPATPTPAPQHPPAAAAYPTTAAPAPTAAAAAAAPPAAIPPTAGSPEKTSTSSNPFVAFFQDPGSFVKLPSFGGKDEIPKPSTTATPQPLSPRPQPAATLATSRTTGSDPYGTMPVGLEGYCPVTLVEKSVWVEGRAQWGVRHRGRTYLFAGQAEQQTFLVSPDRYAPALSGDDPVLAFDAGRQVPGQRRYGVTYQSRIYLFSSPETRNAFTVSPEKYTTRVMVAENPQRTAPGTVVR